MQKNRPVRVIIDTNLWISFIISKKLNQLEPILHSRNVLLLFSEELINELSATIQKPKLQKYFVEGSLEDMLSVFDPFIDFIQVKSRVRVCRDPKDDFLLALAKDGKADFLITGDNDLLDLQKFGLTKILTITQFIKVYKPH